MTTETVDSDQRKLTEERWAALREQDRYTWFRPEQAEVTAYVEWLRAELKETDHELGVSMEAEAKMGEALAACPACKLIDVARQVVASHEDSNGVVTVDRAALLALVEALRQLRGISDGSGEQK